MDGQRIRGRLHRWITDRNYGFIRVSGRRRGDVFVHARHVAREFPGECVRLVPGELLEFSIAEDGFGRQFADHVTRISVQPTQTNEWHER